MTAGLFLFILFSVPPSDVNLGYHSHEQISREHDGHRYQNLGRGSFKIMAIKNFLNRQNGFLGPSGASHIAVSESF